MPLVVWFCDERAGESSILQAGKKRRPERRVRTFVDADADDLDAPSELSPIAITAARDTF